MQNAERVALAIQAAARDLKWQMNVAMMSREFTVPDSHVLKMPGDCIDVTKVGIVNDCNVYILLSETDSIRTNSCGCGSCSKCLYPNEFVNIGYGYPLNYVFNPYSERYGHTQQTNRLGYWRWDKNRGEIQFHVGGPVESGDKVLIEYQTTLTRADLQVWPVEYQSALKYAALRQIFMVDNPGMAQQFESNFRKEIYAIKRLQMPSAVDLVNMFRGARTSAPRS